MTVDLEALQALTEAATPKDWNAEDDAFWAKVNTHVAIYMTRPQVEFAVAAKAAMPELLEEIRQLRDLREDLVSAREQLILMRQQRDQVLALCAEREAQQATSGPAIGAWQFARKVERIYASKEDTEPPARAWDHYTSTGCIHDLHDKCKQTCKYCDLPCLCECHKTSTEEEK